MCSIDCNCVSNNPYKNNIDMKANAPERIWIDPTTDLSKLNGYIDKDSVEYIRKNAFIEKACEYIEEHVEYYMKKDKACNVPLCPQFATKSFIEDFKDYMEKEL